LIVDVVVVVNDVVIVNTQKFCSRLINMSTIRASIYKQKPPNYDVI